MSRYRDTLLASAARTSSGTGSTLDLYSKYGVDSFGRALFVLDVTAVSGTLPTLSVYIQMEGPHGAFMDLAAFASMVATGKRTLVIDTPGTFTEGAVSDTALSLGSRLDLPLGSSYRAVWTIGGTLPSFTFSVTMDIYGA